MFGEETALTSKEIHACLTRIYPSVTKDGDAEARAVRHLGGERAIQSTLSDCAKDHVLVAGAFTRHRASTIAAE